MINYRAFNQRLFTGFIAAIAVIAVVTVVAYKVLNNSRTASLLVSHTHIVIDSTLSIPSLLTDAEDEEDLYIHHGGQKHLQNYYHAINTLKPHLYALRTLVADNPLQVRNVDSLINYSIAALGEMDRVLQSGQATEDEAAEAVTATDGAQDAAIIHCKQAAAIIIATEKKLLLTRDSVGTREADTAIKIIIASAIAVLGILSLLLLYISRTFLTHQRLREQFLVSENMFRGAFKYSGIGMALVSLSGKWIDINPSLLQLLGYTREELLPSTFQDITHPDDLEADLASVARLLKGELETYKMEKRYFHKNGNIVWGKLTVSMVHDESGAPRFFVSQIEDITATKNLIRALELKNEVLSQTSDELEHKIDQLEEFNAIVAHNLRGPAGGIESMLQMIAAEEDPAEKDKMLQLALRSSTSLNATLNDLMRVLEVRLSHDLEYDDCDLNEMVRVTSQLLQVQMLDAQATIHTQFEVSHVRFPRVYLESVFYNIISNSLKYRKPDVPVAINISSTPENGKTRITFEDNGLGIDLDRHGRHIFKLNKVFHKGYNSRGVGLFITKNQLETHGGSITVESRPAMGSKFIIYI